MEYCLRDSSFVLGPHKGRYQTLSKTLLGVPHPLFIFRLLVVPQLNLTSPLSDIQSHIALERFTL